MNGHEMTDPLVQLTAQYADGCFCNRPALPIGPIVGFRPFRFKQAVTAWAAGQQWEVYSFGGTTGKSANVIMPFACAHRPEQRLHIDWRLT